MAIFRRSNLLLTILAVLFALVGIDAAAGQPIVSPVHEYLFNKSLNPVESTAGSIRLSGRIDRAREMFGVQAWVVAAPSGAFEINYHSLRIENAQTGELSEYDEPEKIETLRRNSQFSNAINAYDMGVYRRARLIAVRLNPAAKLAIEGENWSIESFDAELTFSETQAGDSASTDDSAFFMNDSSFRRMIDASVANPEAIDFYAPHVAARPWNYERVEPSGWQPRPESSPDFVWRKIAIEQDGAYAIDGRWLGENGLDAKSIDPASLILMNRGREVAMLKLGPANADFSTGARLIFYALRNASQESKDNIYYLGRRSEGGSLAEFPQAPAVFSDAPELKSYRRTIKVEQDHSLETRIGNFLSIREMTWVWQQLRPEEPLKFEFTTDGLPEPVPSAEGTIRLYIASKGVPAQITLAVKLNGTEIEPGALVKSQDENITLSIPAGLLRHDRNEMELVLHVPERFREQGTPAIYLDHLTLTYESLMKSAQMRHIADFSADDSSTTGPARLQAIGFRPNHLLAIDITDREKPVRLAVDESGGVAWVSAHLEDKSTILLLEDDGIPRAPAGRVSVWRDWRAQEQSADVVIVHHAMFAEQAATLAEAIRSTRREVLLADVESIYESYTAGETDSAAIQFFARDSVFEWKGRRPSHLVLIGDCTRDGQNVARNEILNLMPTFTVREATSAMMDEYASDQYYAWLSGEDQSADIIVSRIPSANVEDAAEMVRKAVAYRDIQPADWTGRMLTVTDPGEFHDVARNLREAVLAPGFDDRAINTAEYPWEDNYYLPREVLEGNDVKVTPIVTNMIERAIEQGALLVTFIGHGSPNIWSNQRIWFGGDSKNSDNLRLDNGDKLPFLISFTCNNGAIDYPVPRWNICIAEDMMRVKTGGYVGMFVPSGPGFTKNHTRLAEGFYDALSGLHIREHGMLAELSRIKYQGVIGNDDHSRMFILLGDPTLEMPVMDTNLELSVSPDVLPEQHGQQEIRVTAKASSPLADGTLIFKSPHDETMGEAPLAVQADGTLAGKLTVDIPVDEFRFGLIAQARDVNGKLYQTGQSYRRAPAEVLITAFRQDKDASISNQRKGTYYLQNRGFSTQQITLNVDLITEGASRRILEEMAVVAPGQLVAIDVGVEADPGIYVLKASVNPSRPTERRVEKPSSISYDGIVVGPATGATDVAIAPNAFRLLPARARSSSPLAEIFVANLGQGSPMASINWKIEYPDGNVITGSKTIGPLSPGEPFRTQIPMRMEMLMRTDLKVELNGETQQVKEENVENNSLIMVLEASQVPDLRIVPGSLEILPKHLAEGLTVFIDGMVENVGTQPSYGCLLDIYPGDDQAYNNALRTLAGQLHNRIPPLQPSQRWKFRVRWDPIDNLGVKEIKLLVDSEQALVESDKDNNIVVIPLDIKSKWNLRPRGMALRRGETPGTVQLIASIENLGETDAQQVSVWFYSDEHQTEAEYIGEVLVPRISALSTIEVPIRWSLEGVDLQKKRNPSFSMALKGSLQRTSSVAQ